MYDLRRDYKLVSLCTWLPESTINCCYPHFPISCISSFIVVYWIYEALIFDTIINPHLSKSLLLNSLKRVIFVLWTVKRIPSPLTISYFLLASLILRPGLSLGCLSNSGIFDWIFSNGYITYMVDSLSHPVVVLGYFPKWRGWDQWWGNYCILLFLRIHHTYKEWN